MRIIDILLQGKRATNDTIEGYYFIEDNMIKVLNLEDGKNEIWESFYIKNDFLLEEGYEYKI